MHTYLFIVPSESITFQTDNDRIAMASCLIIGQGQAAALRIDEVSGIEIKIPSLTIFDEQASKSIENYLGMDLGKFLTENDLKIGECLATFAYTTLDNRKDFDAKFSKMKEVKDKNDFLVKHEKKNRTSMSTWVAVAWSYARAITNKKYMEAINKN
jgi:hypothetical protein